MNEKIKELAHQAGFDAELMQLNHNRGNPSIAEKFANLILGECEDYLNSEIYRLCDYKDSLPKGDSRRDDIDICIEKCYDIMEGLKDHFSDPHPPTRDCGCTTCQKSFDPTEVPDWKFYEKKL